MHFKWSIRILGMFIGLFTLASTAQAQFVGISVDAAIAYSAAPKDIAGGTVGFTHPIPLMPNLGYLRLIFDDREQFTDQLAIETRVHIQTIQFFYHIPFPIVTMQIGIGAGAMETSTRVFEISTTDPTSEIATETVNLTTPVGEGFIRFGLPFWNVFEFHVGYHAISAPAIDRTEGSTADLSSFETERDYSGGMTTVGLQLAF